MSMSEFEQGTPKPPERTERAESGSQLSLWPPEGGEPPPLALPAESRVEPEDPPWSLSDLGVFVLFVALVSLPVAYLAVIGVFLGLRGTFGWEMTVEEAFTHTP